MNRSLRLPVRARWLSWRVMRAKRQAVTLEELWWRRFGPRLRAVVAEQHERENAA